MGKRLLRQSGFNLVELMVVVSIIGVLSSVAVPRFQSFRARAMQTEAKSGLSGLFLAMQSYQANYNEFPAIAGALANAESSNIGFGVDGSRTNFKYSLASAPLGWAGIANSTVAIYQGKYDAHRINANRWLCTAFDSVNNKAATVQATGRSPTAAENCPQQGSGAAAGVTASIVGSAGGTGTDFTD